MDKDPKDHQDWPTPQKDGGTSAPLPLAERRCAFGAKLAARREAHGITAQALAQTTRIGPTFIEALERGDLERLPGEVFGRGFVRSIMKNLGEDSSALLSEFDSLWEKPTGRSVLKVQIKNRPVKVRNDRLQAMIANSRSLVRRGVAVQVAMPLVAAALLVYAFAGTSLLRTLARYARGGTAAMVTASAPVPAKTLDLSTPVAAQAEGGKVAAAEPVGSSSTAAAPAAAPAAATTATTSSSTASEPAAAEGKETAAASPSGTGQQVLEIVVSAPVRIKLDVDHGPAMTKELTPDTYRFTFDDRADMMVYDAAAVKISFNGRPLGSLGTKGRVRRLSFQAHPPAATGL